MSTEHKTHQKPPCRLWISALTDKFDPEQDVPIATWCITDVEGKFPDWEEWDFTEPFPNTGAIPAHTKDINILCAALLNNLKDAKNAQHHVSYGVEYWRILAMHWIVDLVNFAWYRWQEITAMLEQHASKNMHCDIYPENVAWNFEGYGDFNATTLYNIDFSTWVCSKILRMRQPDNIILVDIDFTNDTGPTQVPHIKPPTSRARKMLRQLRAAAKPERCAIGSIGNEYSLPTKVKSIASEGVLGLYLHLLPEKLNRKEPKNAAIEIPRRFPAQFISLVRDLMDATPPNTLGHKFERYRNDALKLTFRPGKLMIQVPAFHLDPATQFKVAHAVDAGEHLVGFQHGGSYGLVSVLQIPPETEYRSFAFITWGWTKHSDFDGNFIRLPSAQLASWRRAKKPSSGRGLFVAQSIRFLPGRISFEGDIFNRRWSRKQRLQFFNALPDHIMGQINYRPYDSLPASLTDTRYFQERLPILKIASPNFHAEMASAKLVMMDHPGTTFFQSMVADIPTIAYWSSDAYPISSQAKPTFDVLKDAGIIFDTSDMAAQHVTKIWDDIDGWWESENVAHARQMFKDNYAYTEPFWLIAWMKALWRL